MEDLILSSKNGPIREQLKIFKLDKIGKYYDKEVKKQNKCFQKFHEKEPEYRYAWIMNNIKEKLTVLDVGIGSGLLVHYLKKKGYEISGCDLSKDIIKRAKENLKDVDLINCPAEKLKFDDNSFDVVTSCQLIEHLKKPEKGISEMYRVSRKKVLITAPIGRNLMDPGHLHFFDWYDICKLIKKSVGHENFTITRIPKILEGEKQNCFAIQIYKGEMDE